MVRQRRVWRCSLIGSGLVGILVAACTKSEDTIPPGQPGTQVATATQPAATSVCPQHQPLPIPERDTLAALTFVMVNQLDGPGGNSQIPEYHDCQRLIKADGSYGPEVAVLADSLVGHSLDSAIAREGMPEPAVLVAVLVAGGNFYELNIRQGLDCVYLFRRGAMLWWFLTYPDDNLTCPRNQAIGTPNWRVGRETLTGGFDATDFSPSARWDYDKGGAQEHQFIGLPCGDGYCMYGKRSVHSSYQHDRSGNRSNRRPWVARTWYDEQLLGVIQGTSGIQPSPVFGTVFPSPGIGERRDVDYEGPSDPWLLTAEIKMTGDLPMYQTTFGLVKTGVNETNKVYLCKGDASRCLPAGLAIPRCKVAMTTGDPWYAKIVPPKGDSVYRCVTRHSHPDFPIPGNARWWWTPVDEGVWMRCPNGCCQVS